MSFFICIWRRATRQKSYQCHFYWFFFSLDDVCLYMPRYMRIFWSKKWSSKNAILIMRQKKTKDVWRYLMYNYTVNYFHSPDYELMEAKAVCGREIDIKREFLKRSVTAYLLILFFICCRFQVPIWLLILLVLAMKFNKSEWVPRTFKLLFIEQYLLIQNQINSPTGQKLYFQGALLCFWIGLFIRGFV